MNFSRLHSIKLHKSSIACWLSIYVPWYINFIRNYSGHK